MGMCMFSVSRYTWFGSSRDAMRRWCGAVLATCLCLFVAVAAGADADARGSITGGPFPTHSPIYRVANGSVEAGQQALQGGPSYPWYDEEKDELRRVDVQPNPKPPQAREWEWKPEEPDSSTPNVQAPNLSGFGAFWNILWWAVVITMILIFVVLLFLMVRAMLNREESASEVIDEIDPVGKQDDVDRVEELPFKVRRPKSNLLDEAREQYEAGNYGEAVIYLFSYQLLELDKGQFIRLTRGKTNRQYMRELKGESALQGIVEPTMLAFEDVFFGNHPLTKDRFEVCWNHMDEFHGYVQEVAA